MDVDTCSKLIKNRWLSIISRLHNHHLVGTSSTIYPFFRLVESNTPADTMPLTGCFFCGDPHKTPVLKKTGQRSFSCRPCWKNRCRGCGPLDHSTYMSKCTSCKVQICQDCCEAYGDVCRKCHKVVASANAFVVAATMIAVATTVAE